MRIPLLGRKDPSVNVIKHLDRADKALGKAYDLGAKTNTGPAAATFHKHRMQSNLVKGVEELRKAHSSAPADSRLRDQLRAAVRQAEDGQYASMKSYPNSDTKDYYYEKVKGDPFGPRDEISSLRTKISDARHETRFGLNSGRGAASKETSAGHAAVKPLRSALDDLWSASRALDRLEEGQGGIHPRAAAKATGKIDDALGKLAKAARQDVPESVRSDIVRVARSLDVSRQDPVDRSGKKHSTKSARLNLSVAAKDILGVIRNAEDTSWSARMEKDRIAELKRIEQEKKAELDKLVDDPLMNELALD